MNIPEKKPFIDLLCAALSHNRLPAFAENTPLLEKLYDLTVEMLTVNESMNLTNITSPEEIVLRHYVDSLSISPYIPAGATVLDLGTGAGFPSLPLALARSDLAITAIDSTEKKIRYVASTAEKLGIDPARFAAKSMRAEEGASVGGELRERFDVVVSRAVAKLSVLSELALPCLKVGGVLLAMKGSRAAEEIAEAASGFSMLGADTPKLMELPLSLPSTDTPEQHSVVLVEKREKSPKIYPRRYAQIVKNPL